MRNHKLEQHDTAASDYDRELHSLLDASIDLPLGQLRPFLERAASSPELAREVETLLLERESPADFSSPLLPGFVSWAASQAVTAGVASTSAS